MSTLYVYSGGNGTTGYGTTDRDDPTQADNWTNALKKLLHLASANPWVDTITYSIGDRVVSSSIYYRSLQNSNTNKTPATEPTYWEVVSLPAALAPGDRIYVAHDHAVVHTLDQTCTFPNGVGGAPVEIICVNRSTGALATTATETQSKDSSVSFVINGNIYVYGCEIRGRSTTSSIAVVNQRQVWDTCIVGTTRDAGTTGAYTIIGPGGSGDAGATFEYKDCTFRFASIINGLMLQACSDVLICGGSVEQVGGNPLNALIRSTRGNSSAIIRGMDLTNLGSSYVISTAGMGKIVKMYGCKGSYNLMSGSGTGCRVEEWSSNSLGAYGLRIQDETAEAIKETTIYRSGGATDGTNSYCIKAVGTSYCRRVSDFCFRLADLHQNLSGKRITVYAARKSAAGSKLNNQQCWIDIAAPDDASPLLNGYSSGNASPIAAGAAYDDSTETWATLTSPYQWKMYVDVPASAVQKGMCQVRFHLGANTSTTDYEVYVCPKVLIEDAP